MLANKTMQMDTVARDAPESTVGAATGVLVEGTATGLTMGEPIWGTAIGCFNGVAVGAANGTDNGAV
jgi:predicted MFS family arabinose efflux permease